MGIGGVGTVDRTPTGGPLGTTLRYRRRPWPGQPRRHRRARPGPGRGGRPRARRGRRVRRAPAARRRRAGPAGLGGVPLRRRRRGPRERRASTSRTPGVLPTPAVAGLVADTDADLGVVLSASHNPMPDNGIKFFARGGHKLPDDVEDAIERRLGEEWARPVGAAVGRVRRVPGRRRPLRRPAARDPAAPAGRPAGRRRLRARRRERRRAPRRCAPPGPSVVVIGAEPDGLNINDGYGSTHLDTLRDAVVDPRRRRRHRATTATPTAASRSTTSAETSTATRSWRSSRSRSRDRGALAERHPRDDGHEQPRAAAARWRPRGHHDAADRGRRPVRPGGDAPRRLLPRRRAVRARRHARPRHDR